MPTSQQLLENLVQLLAATYRVELTIPQAISYAEWCKEIPDRELESVFREAMENSPAFMPTGPGIAAIWKARAVKRDNLTASQEWDLIAAHVNRELYSYEHTTPDGLSDAAQYALRQIGGIEAVYNCLLSAEGSKPDDLKWRGKDFCEAYANYAETGGLKAISRDEARKLLDRAMDLRKQLQGEKSDAQEASRG